MKKRYLSILLVLVLCLGLTIAALASEETAEELGEESAPEEEIIEETEPTQDGATIVDSGTCGDGLTWELDDEGTLTVSGTGRMTSAPWCGLAMRDKVKRAMVGDGVQTLYDNAFSFCNNLESVELGRGLQVIAGQPFRNCETLVSLTVSDGNKTYHSAGNCVILTDTKELVAGCKGSIIPSDGSVTTIGNHAFSGCAGLARITIPGSITSIGFEAFRGCLDLDEVVLQDGVRYIGQSAFSGCERLTEINIPDSVTSIREGAFNYCNGLTEITIPSSVTSIGMYAFSNCPGLISLTVDKDNVTYHSAGNRIIETKRNELVLGCKTSVIPSDGSVTRIESWAFEGCTGITDITIPAGVTSIGQSAFRGCTNLTAITIPNSLTCIEIWAFDDCWGITDVYYSGTEESWRSIEMLDGNNTPLALATVHFGGDPASETPQTPMPSAAPQPTIPSSDPSSDVQGDMDGDGVLTPNDAAIILQICAKG